MSDEVKSWRYAAEDAHGAVISGRIAARDLTSARMLLNERRLTPLTLTAEHGRSLRLLGIGGSKVELSLTELSVIASRLRELLAAGLPLAHALRLAGEQALSPRERAFLDGLLADIRAGRSLSDGLARSDYQTPRLMKALIEAGEALGDLDRQLERLAKHYEDALSLRREILSQLAYPIALVVLIIATLFFLSFLILPQFEGIFATSGAAPPAETRLVLAAGAFIRTYWISFPFIALGIVWSWRYAAKNHAKRFENARLAAPFAGKFVRNAEFGAYFRTLSTLLAGGADISKSMPLARKTVSLSVVQDELGHVEHAVRTGDRLSPALKRLTSCPRELVSFIEIGEETGDLARLAAQAATYAETRTRMTLKRIMALLAPALTALMGLLTAGVIASVMTGVLSLNETIY